MGRDDIERHLAGMSKAQLKQAYRDRFGIPARSEWNKAQIMDKYLFYAWDLHEGHKIIRGD